MGTTYRAGFFQLQSKHILYVAAAVLAAVTPFIAAQTTEVTTSGIAVEGRVALPDAPAAMTSSSDEGAGDPSQSSANSATVTPNSMRFKHSAHFAMTIAPNEIALPMTTHDKVVSGLKDSVSLFSATGWFAAAGYEQLTNGSPNYGTDRGAFGQRMGAAAVRGISENIFSESLFAPVFHEDPRYYIMGNRENFFKRVVYAGTRVLITKTDSGRTTPNFSLLVGNAAGSALTIPYYPSINTSFSEVAKTYGGSLGGSALGFVVTEFIGDALTYVHLKKQP